MKTYGTLHSLVARRREPESAEMFDYPEQDFRHQFEMILEGARQLDLAKTTLQVRIPPSPPTLSFQAVLWNRNYLLRFRFRFRF
jgi:hypothetical protein